MKSQSRSLAFDALWSLILKVFGALSNLLVTLILARLMDASTMGEFLLAVSIAFAAAMIARAGMKQPVVKLVAASIENGKPENIKSGLVAVVFLVALGCSLVVAAVELGLGAVLFEQVLGSVSLLELLTIWLLVVIVLAFQTPLAESFRGLGCAREAMLFDGPLVNFFFLLFLLVALSIGKDLDLEVGLQAFLVSATVALAVGVIALFRKLPRGKFLEGAFPLKVLVREGLPAFVVNISGYIVSQSGLWICGALLLAADAAMYGVSLRLILLVSLPLFVLNLVIQPKIVSLYVSGQKQLLERQVRTATTMATLVSLPIATLFLMFPEHILIMLFGPEYKDAAFILAVLTLGQLVNVAAGPCLNLVLLVGKRYLVTLVVVICGILSVVLAYYMAKSWGAVGVASAGSIGMAVQNLTVLAIAKKYSDINSGAFIRPGDLRGTYRQAKEFIVAKRSS